MALTPEERLAFLYRNQGRPAPVPCESTEQGILSESTVQLTSNTTSNLVKRPKPSPLADQLKQDPTRYQPDHQYQSDSDIEDDYIAACAAKVRPTNVIIHGQVGGHSKKRGHGKHGAETNHSRLESGAQKAESSSNPAIPRADQFGNPLVSQYCNLELVAVFPYKFVSKAASDHIAKKFFDQGKIWSNDWQIYYIHSPTYSHTRPLLLVPFVQFQKLLDRINTQFKSEIVAPLGESIGLVLPFYDDQTPQPSYIGQASDRDHIVEMQSDIPPPEQDYGEPPIDANSQVRTSFAAFKRKIELANEAARRKNKAAKKKRMEDRIAEQQKWCQSLKRGQRYVGLRPRFNRSIESNVNQNLSWGDQQKAEQEANLTSGRTLMLFDCGRVSPYEFEGNPIIIAFDVESNERDHQQVTEIGVSTLDTLDIENVPPGEGGCNWRAHIRSRHFRAKEYLHHTNKEFCIGDPSKFRFGRSEVVALADAARSFDSCFQYPFSAAFKHPSNDSEGVKDSSNISESKRQVEELSDGGNTIYMTKAGYSTGPSDSAADSRRASSAEDEETTKSPAQKGPRERKIILVGHDIMGDIAYLRIIDSTILHEGQEGPDGNCIWPTIIETLDTAVLNKVLLRNTTTMSLANILVHLGITGWDLHNAGNDARYTLEALLGILIKARVEEDERQNPARREHASADKAWEDEVQRRIDRKCQDAEEQVRTEVATWEAAIDGKRSHGHIASNKPKDLGTIPAIQSTDSAAPTDQRLENSNWIFDMEDASLLHDRDIDGGEPEGWYVRSKDQKRARASKQAGSAKKREADEWYQQYTQREQQGQHVQSSAW